MRPNWIPALLATIVLAAPLWAAMQQSGRPSGDSTYGALPARPQPATRYAAPAQPRFVRPQSPAPYARPVQPRFANPRPTVRAHGPHSGDWLRETMGLTPQEQRRKLEQDQRFRQLPPQRQEQLLKRLQAFNSMSPQMRQRILDRMEMLEHLPPEQQRRAQQLFGQFRALDPQRKNMIRHTLRQMRAMSPDARLRFLNSPGIRSTYTPQEIHMLYDFNSIGFVGPQQ